MKKKILLFISLFILVGCSNTTTNENTNDLVVVSDGYEGELLALDANLAAGNFTYSSILWDSYKEGVSDHKGNFELMAAAKPDVIVTYQAQNLDKYKKITDNVVFIEWGKYETRELMLELAKATNTIDNANKWIADFDAKVNTTKESLTDAQKNYTYSIVDVFDGKTTIYGDNFGRGGEIIYRELQLKPSDKVKNELIDKNIGYLPLSNELVNSYLGDVVIEMTSEENSSLKKSLDSNKKYVKISPDYFWYSDPISLTYQLDNILNILNEIK